MTQPTRFFQLPVIFYHVEHLQCPSFLLNYPGGSQMSTLRHFPYINVFWEGFFASQGRHFPQERYSHLRHELQSSGRFTKGPGTLVFNKLTSSYKHKPPSQLSHKNAIPDLTYFLLFLLQCGALKTIKILKITLN